MPLGFCIVQGCSRCDEFFPKENGRCAECNHPMSTHHLSEGTELQPEVIDLCDTKSPTPSPLKVQSQHSTHALIASDVLGSTLQEAREDHKKTSKGKGSAARKEVKTIQEEAILGRGGSSRTMLFGKAALHPGFSASLTGCQLILFTKEQGKTQKWLPMCIRWDLPELDFDIPDYQQRLTTQVFEHPSWIDRSLPERVIFDGNMERGGNDGGEIITDRDKDLQIKRLDGGGTLRELLMKMALPMTYVMGDPTKKRNKAAVIRRFILIIPVLDTTALIMDNDSENDIENMNSLGVSSHQSRLSPVHIKKEKIVREVIYPCADHNTLLQSLTYFKFQKSQSKSLQRETFPLIKPEKYETNSEKHKRTASDMSVLDNDIATMRPTRKEQQVLGGGKNHSDVDTKIDSVSSIHCGTHNTLDDEGRTGTHESENIPINPFSLSHILSP